jgi:hypothetical protein
MQVIAGTAKIIEDIHSVFVGTVDEMARLPERIYLAIK